MTTPRLLSERYELGEVLGYGGMSEVHRGLDTRLGRDVAVKVLRADLARDPQFQMRFRREAQNAAALNHPAIVAVYDTGEVSTDFGPLPYIVMEYVDGQTLREIVNTTGPMTQAKVIEVMADVCAALDFSHRHNIIHRDVKPANIMINEAGAVKVMDFGIARALGEGQNFTQTAAVIGTAQYLSPEQARGEAVDARSDVYAAGCVLFELLTGEPPFTGESPVAVAYQHVREDPRLPSELNASIPPALDAVVLKALSKNPLNRYQSAAEMRSDLVRVRSGQSPMAPVVMNSDERTAMLAADPATGPTRRINGRHAPAPAHDYYDDEPRRGVGRIIGVTVAVLVALGLVGFVAYQLLSGPRQPVQVAVPSVVGATEQDARNQLDNAGLRVGEVQRVESDVDEIDTVLSTDPAPGVAVDERTAIGLQVGSGPVEVTVPRLIGLTVEQATADLTAAGLVPGTRTEQETPDAAQVGKVTTSDPEPGTRVAGKSAVNIVIGLAQTTVPVPDVSALSATNAQQRLEEAGFAVQRSEVDGGGEEGEVLATVPPAGTVAKKGSPVVLQVSSGNGGQQAQIPDVRSLEESEAKQQLRSAGFDRVRTQKDQNVTPGADGLVVRVSPDVGELADTDDQVTLFIGDP